MSSERKARFKLFIVFAFFTGLIILTVGPRGYTQSAQKIKSEDEIVREEMIEISKQLNVTCTECHKPDNFRDNNKPNYHIAKEHMKIVELLKANGFDGKQGPKATCYMCHRGELRPAYKENMKVVKVPVKEAEPKDGKKPEAGKKEEPAKK
jgi:hypothetical protein